jgi:hypothetical protein
LRIERLRGRPLEGIVVSVFDRECEGVVGWCTSVAIAARYWMTFFVLSVFPAPDSPLRSMSIIMIEMERLKTYVMRIL